jgi:predicted transcriptional regulator
LGRDTATKGTKKAAAGADSPESARTSRERLHRFIEELPESELERALINMEILARVSDHPAFVAMRKVLAKMDFEELSPQDRKALDEAYADLRSGRMLTHDEVRKRWLEEG